MSRRWIGWHVFCLFLVVVLTTSGVWQWNVAVSSTGLDGESNVNIRNLVYAMQWWVFAIFGVWFWLRFLRDQRDADREEAALAEDKVAGTDTPQPGAREVGHAAANQHGSGSKSTSGSSAMVEKNASATVAPISLDDSAEVRRRRSRARVEPTLEERKDRSQADPTSDSDSVTPSGQDNRTVTER